MIEGETFSFARFEHCVYGRRYEEAATELLNLLKHLHLQSGRLGELGTKPAGDPQADRRDAYFATRLASAVSALFADANFHISDAGFRKFIPFQRWLAAVFGATPFGNADHVLHHLNRDGFAPDAPLAVGERDLLKYCLLCSLDSEAFPDPEALWGRNRQVAAALFVSLLASPIVASANAQARRDELLAWLPPRLGELSLDDFPLNILHDVWMNCSYADAPGKHAVKRAINGLIRARLVSIGCADVAPGEAPARARPVALCIVEWFHSAHSIYRTHSASMEAMKPRYRLVGISLREASDEVSRQVFDEVHVLPGAGDLLENVLRVRQLAAEIRPDLVYYPSVGMFPETVFLVNLRLARLQLAGLGHPATMHSPLVDGVLVEEDFIGDPECFSERLVALSPGSMPFRPPAHWPPIRRATPTAGDGVRIAVAASPMKINAPFLAALREIASAARARVQFRFFSAGLAGLGKIYLQNLVRSVLPGAVVNPDLPGDRYLEALGECDLFVNPFPFGNTNGIVDTMRLGLPGVCMSGPEVHTHIDEALFRRFGLPEWLIARSVAEYVRAAVRLVDDAGEREALGKLIRRSDVEAVLFRGEPQRFVSAVEWLRTTFAQETAALPKLLRPPLEPRPARSGTAGSA